MKHIFDAAGEPLAGWTMVERTLADVLHKLAEIQQATLRPMNPNELASDNERPITFEIRRKVLR